MSEMGPVEKALRSELPYASEDTFQAGAIIDAQLAELRAKIEAIGQTGHANLWERIGTVAQIAHMTKNSLSNVISELPWRKRGYRNPAKELADLRAEVKRLGHWGHYHPGKPVAILPEGEPKSKPAPGPKLNFPQNADQYLRQYRHIAQTIHDNEQPTDLEEIGPMLLNRDAMGYLEGYERALTQADMDLGAALANAFTVWFEKLQKIAEAHGFLSAAWWLHVEKYARLLRKEKLEEPAPSPEVTELLGAWSTANYYMAEQRDHANAQNDEHLAAYFRKQLRLHAAIRAKLLEPKPRLTPGQKSALNLAIEWAAREASAHYALDLCSIRNMFPEPDASEKSERTCDCDHDLRECCDKCQYPGMDPEPEPIPLAVGQVWMSDDDHQRRIETVDYAADNVRYYNVILDIHFKDSISGFREYAGTCILREPGASDE